MPKGDRGAALYEGDDFYDEEDYYEEYYDEEEDTSHKPPSRTGSALVDYFTLDRQSEVVTTFIAKAHEIFGPSTFTEQTLLEVLNRQNSNIEEAITVLMEQKARDEAAALKEEAQSYPPLPPPGFSPSEKQKLPVSPVPKRAVPLGISMLQAAGKKKNDGKKKQPSGNTPPTPPLGRKVKGGSRTNSPAITGTASPVTLSRSNSRSSLHVSTSSGQLNRMAPLSDDEYEYEDISSAAVARLTLVVAGHVDAGKSTLVGHLLYRLGAGVTERQLLKYEKQAGEMGKGSFHLAWVMDESESEREHGVTIGLAERFFRTKNYDFTVLDAPGHRDFIPTMISGANQADVALLVIPATEGEYESSMSDNAQTREHAILLKALGVNQVIVVINKMDLTNPPWCKDRYALVQSEIRTLLTGLHFGHKAVRFVPVSSLNGINLNPLSESPMSASASLTKSIDSPNSSRIKYAKGVACPELFKWYIGPSLVELLDSFKSPPREINKPLRAIITTLISESAKGIEIRVKVLQGALRKRRGVGISLVTGVFDVKKIIKEDGTGCESLPAGEEATVLLSDRAHRNFEEVRLKEGLVIYKGPPFPRTCTAFKGNVLTFSPLVPPIIPGSTYELYLHGEEHQCHIRKIYSMTTNKNDIMKKPKCVPGDRSASVKVEVSTPISMETFINCKALGRFALRSKGKTCAVGICDSIKKLKTEEGSSNSDKKAC